MKLLEGKTAIVTGSNRGIGREILEKFAENGANVFACARKHTEQTEQDFAGLQERYGVEIIPVYFDFEDRQMIRQAVQEIKAHKKRIDILVNNAGVLSEYQLFGLIPIDRVKKLFEIDYFAQMEFTQYILRIMQKNGGSIVFISSIAALDAFFSSYDYAACKSAMNISMEQIAREMGACGIRANAVAPGVIETDMIKDVDAKSKESLLPSIYLNRYGTKTDVANAVLFLASDMSSYITGQVLRVDGGIAPPRAKW